MEKAIRGDVGCPVPAFTSVVVRGTHCTTPEQRGEMLKRTEYNPFSFPAGMLIVDYLSDSGSSAMTDVQWAAMFRADESYGRNHGYYALQDAVRDIFERGDDQKRLVEKVIIDQPNDTWLPPTEEDKRGGFVNSGKYQLEHPNFFITPQGRCAENILYSTLREILTERSEGKDTRFVIPSNGWFDTTEAHARNNKIQPVNLFAPNFNDPFDPKDVGKKNTFKGDIDLNRLVELIEKEGPANVPLILLTITNNTGAGQPVSMKCMKECSAISKKYGIPLWYDAARFAENAFFIYKYEEGYSTKSIPEIVKEMFSYCDGFTLSAKKDGLCNMGGILTFRDQGMFYQKYTSPERDLGVRMKEKQILMYGNDSYGAMSGRDIMALATGLYQTTRLPYLEHRIAQVQSLVMKMHDEGVPVILPPGGHAAFIDVNKFFTTEDGKPMMPIEDFAGVGLTIEMIRRFGIRACELGAFAFEWDLKTEEERKGIVNLVRLAVTRNTLSEEHITYTAKAMGLLYRERHTIPKVVITRGKNLKLRHFQSGLAPIYPEGFKE
eukprot:MONOS_8559.1-p1 / transcript=MONOS_8559.1 / gene=MONOS_8559 / organism=Monocercomonoides_exilis_PA203 / gene_product=Tryptophanase / transcript_product=Tryptophanase / location=Mono_scaffold00325:62321-64108(+) / protein_length=549 / sequence_SO=supercontig / SO=protein_coding / is_pseudo=false